MANLCCLINPIRECDMCGLKCCDDHYFENRKSGCEAAPRHLREPFGNHSWRNLEELVDVEYEYEG